jgi:Arc/MetJ-type ribon-helix-helix transcriptional regulator
MSELMVEISLPKRLADEVQAEVKAGWYPDLNSLVVEAVRRYLETHHGELKEQSVRQDVMWGLYGDD